MALDPANAVRNAGLMVVLAFVAASPILVSSYQETHDVIEAKYLVARDYDPTPIWPLPEDPAKARKAKLINTLLPAIQHSNNQIMAKRTALFEFKAKIESGESLSRKQRQWLSKQSKDYRIGDTLSNDNIGVIIDDLLSRIDIIPADLALAQGAMESAWGTSRFATDANNYFGHWCFVEGCGLIPAQRPSGSNHEVAKFDSAEHSVQRYMHNLNSHRSYSLLRQIRANARLSNTKITGKSLAAGLEKYSAIGKKYVDEIRSLIRFNQFDRFDSL